VRAWPPEDKEFGHQPPSCYFSRGPELLSFVKTLEKQSETKPREKDFR
jgi:hypothetical protein